jgi:hypothetical protein
MTTLTRSQSHRRRLLFLGVEFDTRFRPQNYPKPPALSSQGALSMLNRRVRLLAEAAEGMPSR